MFFPQESQSEVDWMVTVDTAPGAFMPAVPVFLMEPGKAAA
jgi:hypothetical protein